MSEARRGVGRTPKRAWKDPSHQVFGRLNLPAPALLEEQAQVAERGLVEGHTGLLY
jgi:hypothetical protein